MDKIKVYDLPTRLFHWLFAGTFVAAFFIAKAIDDDSPVYSYHMLLGFFLAAIVTLRVIWGVIGSRYARFSSFALNPLDLIRYLKNLLGPTPSRTLGHNPASSWAALLMMGLAMGLALTGYLMTSGGDKEILEEVHEVLANTLAVTAILHVAGVAFHTLRHRDIIGLAMVSGKKKPVGGQEGIDHSYRGVGLIFIALVVAFAFHLGKYYDSGAQTLSLFGNTLQLSDAEHGEHQDEKRGDDGDDSDDDDDHGDHED